MATTNTPKIGQLLFSPYIDNIQEHSSLFFVDSEIENGKSWPYTQIALMEDFDKTGELDVYCEFESGMMPAYDALIAEDADIAQFIVCLLKKGKEGIDGLEMWMENIEADEVLLPEEKSRIKKLIEELKPQYPSKEI